MSRQQPQGVVLTGYHSNLELLPKTGPRAAASPADPDPEPEPSAPRWEYKSVRFVKTARLLVFVSRESAREQRSMIVLVFFPPTPTCFFF